MRDRHHLLAGSSGPLLSAYAFPKGLGGGEVTSFKHYTAMRSVRFAFFKPGTYVSQF